MAWEDRPYYRDQSSHEGRGLWWLLSGSVPFITAFGIRVRIHVSLLFLVALTLLLNWTQGYNLPNKVVSLSALFVVILLHEFGHCFAARSVGGDARDILMWPLGGLAYAETPHRPWPTFVMVAGGPLVNVIICIACAAVVWLLRGTWVSLNPFDALPPKGVYLLTQPAIYPWWLFRTSYWLLLFNLLPIYPLDGGQMLHAALWPKLGYYRSSLFSYRTGMFGSIGLAIFGLVNFNLFLLLLAGCLFYYCWQHYQMLKEMGPEDWAAEYDGIDYGASLRLRPENETPRKKRRSLRHLKRLRKQAAMEVAEQEQIDAILAKVSAHGMQSLTWAERRALKRATERQRRSEMEIGR
jgi:stage IV sporulation protein FB